MCGIAIRARIAIVAATKVGSLGCLQSINEETRLLSAIQYYVDNDYNSRSGQNHGNLSTIITPLVEKSGVQQQLAPMRKYPLASSTTLIVSVVVAIVGALDEASISPRTRRAWTDHPPASIFG